MDDRTRIAAYLTSLVAVFALAWTVGNATADDSREPANPPAEHPHPTH